MSVTDWANYPPKPVVRPAAERSLDGNPCPGVCDTCGLRAFIRYLHKRGWLCPKCEGEGLVRTS